MHVEGGWDDVLQACGEGGGGYGWGCASPERESIISTLGSQMFDFIIYLVILMARIRGCGMKISWSHGLADPCLVPPTQETSGRFVFFFFWTGCSFEFGLDIWLNFRMLSWVSLVNLPPFWVP